MWTLNSASKSGEIGRVLSQPLREHELLGLPKSTGKQRPQPVLMKDLLGPIEWEKVRQPVNTQRRTMMADTLNYTRTKLGETSRYNDSPIACGKKTGGNAHLSGLSKSEGKLNETGAGRKLMQPEKMKHLMESWEKAQIERSTRSTKKDEVRNQKVRRKLYNHLPSSPKSVVKHNQTAKKSEMKTQKPLNVDVKTAPTSNACSRRSRLVPPNAIRDKYVRLQDAITEESTLSIGNASLNTTSVQRAQKINFNDGKNERQTKKGEETENEPLENEQNTNDHEIDELPNSVTLINTQNDRQDKNNDRTTQRVVVRPSVIMGVPATELRKEQSAKSKDNEKTNASNSYVLLREPNRSTSLHGEKLNAMDNSFDDNFGNISHSVYGESFYHNLPQNSFLKPVMPTENFFIHVDRQTIQWMHANVKLQVQSTEEQLFSMKRLLRTLEDLMKDQEKEEIQATQSPIESEDIPAGQVNDTKSNAIDENGISGKVGESSCEIPIVKNKSKKSFEIILTSPSNKDLLNDQENSPLSQNIDDGDKENMKSADKPRRRSARLAGKMSQSPKLLADSFSSIERKLNIVHAKKKDSTPVKTKSGGKIDPRCRRSVREYMALKSSMNFLATPDVKGCQAAIEDKRTPSRVRSTRRDLSRKLLNELEDLYADSPI